MTKYGLTGKVTDEEMLLYINNLAYYYWLQGSEDTEQNWLDAEYALKLLLTT